MVFMQLIWIQAIKLIFIYLHKFVYLNLKKKIIGNLNDFSMLKLNELVEPHAIIVLPNTNGIQLLLCYNSIFHLF